MTTGMYEGIGRWIEDRRRATSPSTRRQEAYQMLDFAQSKKQMEAAIAHQQAMQKLQEDQLAMQQKKYADEQGEKQKKNETIGALFQKAQAPNVAGAFAALDPKSGLQGTPLQDTMREAGSGRLAYGKDNQRFADISLALAKAGMPEEAVNMFAKRDETAYQRMSEDRDFALKKSLADLQAEGMKLNNKVVQFGLDHPEYRYQTVSDGYGGQTLYAFDPRNPSKPIVIGGSGSGGGGGSAAGHPDPKVRSKAKLAAETLGDIVKRIKAGVALDASGKTVSSAYPISGYRELVKGGLPQIMSFDGMTEAEKMAAMSSMGGSDGNRVPVYRNPITGDPMTLDELVEEAAMYMRQAGLDPAAGKSKVSVDAVQSDLKDGGFN